jgi:hypothetical protein
MVLQRCLLLQREDTNYTFQSTKSNVSFQDAVIKSEMEDVT